MLIIGWTGGWYGRFTEVLGWFKAGCTGGICFSTGGDPSLGKSTWGLISLNDCSSFALSS